MAPPAKRRRRNVVEASDDEDDKSKANTLTNFFLSSPSSPSLIRDSRATPSPRKPVSSAVKNGSPLASKRRHQPLRNGVGSSSRGGSKEDQKDKTADLKTLFSKQAQRATEQRSVSALDDPFCDAISDDDEISEVKASSSSLVSQQARKRLKSSGTQPTLDGTFSISQRFLKPAPPPPRRPESGKSEDSRPWSERFGPRNLDELAVHKRKVADVRRWLEDVMGGRLRQRLLVLKGAAGSGKTTTVRLLAKDMNCEVLEWKPPASNSAAGFVSASARFEEFLGRGGKFGALDLEGPASPPTPTSSHDPSRHDETTRKIILVEDFPNTFSRASSALASFRQALLGHVASHMPSSMAASARPSGPISPVVLVISETLLTTTSASADSLTAHRLLGADLLGHAGVGVIEFNAMAPTLLAKALELVVHKESRTSGRRRTPGPLVLKRLGEIGDVRSAISSLEFLCLKGDQDGDWGDRVTFTKAKKGGSKTGLALTRGEEESLELVTRREASLGIFHAVGKVVYNRREETASGDAAAERLPPFLAQHQRPKRSEVSVDALMDEMGTDTHTFISALHENYVLSCESTGPMDLSTPMDYVNECIENLSQSDLLCPSRDVFFGGAGGGGNHWDAASQLLRQDEMMFRMAVQGLLFSLPNPVKRKAPPRGAGHKAADAFKMFYPSSIKLWRAKEEMEGVTAVWASRLLRGGDDEDDDEPHDARLLSLGNTARGEMLLDRLPYMAQVARGRKRKTARLRELERIVAFAGAASVAPDEDEPDGEEGVSGEAWATDRPEEGTSPRRRRAGIRAGSVTGMAQKLVLSDDDIED